MAVATPDPLKLTTENTITAVARPGKAAQEVSQDTTLSNVPLKEGHSYTVRELYQATLIYSANGAAMQTR